MKLHPRGQGTPGAFRLSYRMSRSYSSGASKAFESQTLAGPPDSVEAAPPALLTARRLALKEVAQVLRGGFQGLGSTFTDPGPMQATRQAPVQRVEERRRHSEPNGT